MDLTSAGDPSPAPTVVQREHASETRLHSAMSCSTISTVIAVRFSYPGSRRHVVSLSDVSRRRLSAGSASAQRQRTRKLDTFARHGQPEIACRIAARSEIR